MTIEMRTNTQLCRAQCAWCHLLCIHSRLHDGDHSCETTHKSHGRPLNQRQGWTLESMCT